MSTTTEELRAALVNVLEGWGLSNEDGPLTRADGLPDLAYDITQVVLPIVQTNLTERVTKELTP